MASVAKSLDAAVAHHQQGRLEQAERLYRVVLRTEPAHADALHLLGVAAYQRGLARVAVDYIGQAIARRPDVAAFHSSLGAALRLEGAFDLAVESYREAIRLAPAQPGAHYNLGLALERLGRTDEAADAYQAALRAAPGFGDAHNNLGNLRLGQGLLDAALESFRAAIDAQDERPEFHFNLANALRAAERTNDAILEFRRSLLLKPDYPDALNNLGNLLKQQGEIDEAIACFEEVVRIDPRHRLAQANLGSALQLLRRYDEASQHLEAAWKLLPDDPDVAAGFARELQRRRCFDEAADIFRRVLAKHPAHARACFGMAAIRSDASDFDEAAAWFERGLAAAPDDLSAWTKLALIRSSQGDVDRARAGWDCALRLGADPLDARLNISNAHLFAGRFAEAHAGFAEAVQAAPEHAEAWNNLGNAANALGRVDEAIRCYERSLEIQPDAVGTRSNLGEMLRGQGRLEEAAEHFRHGFSSPLGPRLRLQEAMLLPQLYESAAEMSAWRDRLERRVDGLLDEGFAYDPASGIAPHCFYLAYQGIGERELLERIDRLYRPGPLPEPRGSAPGNDGRIRVGFLSQHFRNHTIAYLMHGLIAGLPRDRFHVTGLTHVPHDDEWGRRIRTSCDEYTVLTEHVPLAVRRAIDARLDVLFFADLGMDPFTSALARCRLAPVQCTTWGHPVTTGMRTIDHFLSSELVEPHGAAADYTERLVPLATLPACVERPSGPSRPWGRAELRLPENRTLYCCPQSLFKFHLDFDPLLAEILRRDPRGCLAVIASPQEKWNEVLRARLARLVPDIDERVIFLRRLPSDAFLGLLAVADVLLDTIHFGGGKTSYEALGMGVPVVTWPGRFARGRVTLGIYRTMGVSECIAGSAEEYVDLAVRLGTDREFAAHARDRIRATSGALFDDGDAVREIADFLQRAVASGAAPALRCAAIHPPQPAGGSHR
ncbi:MAG: tetratricopeptide repeat protein [Planctomycetales bacterium]